VLEELDEHGYAVIRGVLATQQCEELERRVALLFDSGHERSRQVLYVDGQVPSETPPLDALMHQWLNPHRYDDGLGTSDLTERPRAIASALLGAEPVLFQDLLLVKTPDQRRFPWHQDFPFWPVDRPRGVVCWIPLTLNTAEGGGLAFLPGSHRGGSMPAIDLHRGTPQDGRAAPAIGLEKAVCPSLGPGDAVFFSPLVLHGSTARKTAGVRIAWSSIWLHPEVRWQHSRAPAHPLCNEVADGERVMESLAPSTGARRAHERAD